MTIYYCYVVLVLCNLLFLSRSVSLMANVLKATCQGCNSNCVAFVTANQIQPVIDVLIHLYLVSQCLLYVHVLLHTYVRM